MEMDRMLYDMIDTWWLLLIDHDFGSEKDVNKIIGKVMDWRRLHEIHTGIHVGSGDVLHADTIHFSVSSRVLSHFSQWTVMNKARAPQLGYCLGSQLPTGFNAEKGDKWVKIYRKLMEMVLAILPGTTRFPVPKRVLPGPSLWKAAVAGYDNFAWYAIITAENPAANGMSSARRMARTIPCLRGGIAGELVAMAMQIGISHQLSWRCFVGYGRHI